MVDLSAPEARVVLWLICLLEVSYSGEAPEGTLIAGLKDKMEAELVSQPAMHGQRGASLG